MSDQEEIVSGEEEYEEDEIEESVATEAPPPPTVEEPAAEPEPEAAEEGEQEEKEEGEEGDENEAPQDLEAPVEKRRSSRATVQPEEPDESTMTEAQLAMLHAKKRKEQEDELKAMDADSRRKQELKNIEEELIVLKQRQEERRREREIEEREEAERRKVQEEKRKAEELERREKMEAEKQRRAEEKVRRAAAAGSFAGFAEAGEVTGGPNFVITKGERKEQEKEKKKTGMSKEQKEALKANYMSIVNKPADVSNAMPNDIKNKIKQVYQKILRLESEKYDLEKRHERQDYDLKELIERQSQQARNKAIAAGVEIEQAEAGGLVRPPKISVASKHDRQVDRRTYKEKFGLFENPYVRPPPSIARGSGRPPTEWGRKQNDELENIRKNLDPSPRYVEIAPVEGDEAKPPVEVIPMQIPTEEFDPSLEDKSKAKSTRPFGDSAGAENGTTEAPTGGDTELEIVEEPVDA